MYIDNCNFRLNLKTKESKQTVACLASRSMINNPGLLPPSVCLVGIAPFTKVLLKKDVKRLQMWKSCETAYRELIKHGSKWS